MKLTVLGSGTCIPYPNRGNPGYLLQIDSHLILLDPGAGALRQVANTGHDYREIHHVFYSHLHPDHTMDFIPLLFALKNDFSITGTQELSVTAPKGFGEYWTQLRQIYGRWVDSDTLQLNISEYTSGMSFDLGFARVRTGPVFHTDRSIAFRIEDREEGHIFVYSGDTGYSEKFAAFARGANLLLLECAVPDSTPYDKHTSPSQAGKMAAIARAETTILTHFYPVMEQEDIMTTLKQYYHGEILLAEDGMTYELP